MGALSCRELHCILNPREAKQYSLIWKDTEEKRESKRNELGKERKKDGRWKEYGSGQESEEGDDGGMMKKDG